MRGAQAGARGPTEADTPEGFAHPRRCTKELRRYRGFSANLRFTTFKRKTRCASRNGWHPGSAACLEREREMRALSPMRTVALAGGPLVDASDGVGCRPRPTGRYVWSFVLPLRCKILLSLFLVNWDRQDNQDGEVAPSVRQSFVRGFSPATHAVLGQSPTVLPAEYIGITCV